MGEIILMNQFCSEIEKKIDDLENKTHIKLWETTKCLWINKKTVYLSDFVTAICEFSNY